MAIVILCGLFTATALNMVVVPALYLRFGAVRERIARLADRRAAERGSGPPWVQPTPPPGITGPCDPG